MKKLQKLKMSKYNPTRGMTKEKVLTGVCTEEFTGVETVYEISYYKGSSDIYLITKPEKCITINILITIFYRYVRIS